MNLHTLTNRIGSRKARRGANAVEFALTAPVLFFLILATMDFGWYFAHLLILESATTHAARVASLVIGSDDLTSVTAPLTEGQAKWDQFGLPGTAQFTLNLTNVSGVDIVEVTGTIPYGAFGGWNKLLGDMDPLPNTVNVTVARRLEYQISSVVTP